MLLCKAGMVKQVKEYLKCGANINQTDNEQQNALFYTVYAPVGLRGCLIRILLLRGADYRQKNIKKAF